jgi:hypothetical protein
LADAEDVPETDTVPGLKVLIFVEPLSLTSGQITEALLTGVVVDCAADLLAEPAELAAGLA